jgi:2-(3-amino-3-carboxypropyl)histidine synthase
MKCLKELGKNYDLQIDKAVEKIKKEKAKLVLLQFPEGLKPYAVSVVDFLREKTKGKTEFLIWFNSCYGACDFPVEIEHLKPKIDLIIQFGHNGLMPEY